MQKSGGGLWENLEKSDKNAHDAAAVTYPSGPDKSHPAKVDCMAMIVVRRDGHASTASYPRHWCTYTLHANYRFASYIHSPSEKPTLRIFNAIKTSTPATEVSPTPSPV